MALSVICLLALIAVSAAYSPQPPRCYSQHLSRHFYNGDKWTEQGCVQAECDNGQARLLPCGLLALLDPNRPTTRCRQVEGPADAEYPACCPKAVCDQCYSQELDRVFDNGDVWTEAGCTQVTCDNGEVRRLPCGLVKLEAGCRLEDGPAGAEYPSCCPQPVCPRPDQCYSKELDQVFNDGDVWTEAGCTQVTCNKGTPVRLQCGLLAPQPGCQLKDGPADAQHPACCPKLDCPSTNGYY